MKYEPPISLCHPEFEFPSLIGLGRALPRGNGGSRMCLGHLSFEAVALRCLPECGHWWSLFQPQIQEVCPLQQWLSLWSCPSWASSSFLALGSSANKKNLEVPGGKGAAGGGGQCDCCGERPTEVDAAFATRGRACQLKTGTATCQGLTWQREWSNLWQALSRAVSSQSLRN